MKKSEIEIVDPRMYAQGILEKIEILDGEIETLRQKAEKQRRFIFRHSDTGTSSLTADLRGEIHGKGRVYKWNEEEIQKFLDMCYDVEKREAERDEIIENIGKIRNRTRRKILFMRFVKRLKWLAIANSLNMSVRNTYNVLDKALLDFFIVLTTN